MKYLAWNAGMEGVALCVVEATDLADALSKAREVLKCTAHAKVIAMPMDDLPHGWSMEFQF